MRDLRFAALLQRKRAAIMGVVNVTPDSFSDGGEFYASDAAIKHGLTLIKEGADILDIGGESTRPGAQAVTTQVELDRVMPVIEGLRKESDVCLSVDTSNPSVMQAATSAGAELINDVRALTRENALAVARDANVYICLMHMQGTPQTMQAAPSYTDVIDDVAAFLATRLQAAKSAGIDLSKVLVDPGIGFGKRLEHNLSLLKHIQRLKTRLERPVLIGVSRKSMINALLDREVDERLFASVGLAAQAALNGANVIRVHDVRATFDAVRCVEAVNNAQ